MGDELILVIDDERAILRALTAAISANGFRVVTASTGAEALRRVVTDNPAVVVLDLGLPDVDGLAVCEEVRAWSSVPVIVLTAEGSNERKVEALDLGADDYVTKPFNMSELLARIRVALRHQRLRSAADLDSPVYAVGDLVVDVSRRSVSVGERAVELTRKEFGFLAALARHPGRVLTHRAILEEVWGPTYGEETHYLRVYVSQLRKKLAGSTVRIITEPGIGYRLLEPEG